MILEYLDRSVDGIDDKESARDFLQSIEDFTTRKAHEAAAIRKQLGVPDQDKNSRRRKTHLKIECKYSLQVMINHC